MKGAPAWFEVEEGAEVDPDRFWADVRAVWSSLSWRRDRWETALSLCMEQTISSLRPGDQRDEIFGDDWEPLSINAVESVVETLHARMTSSQIKPQFVTSGAGYGMRRAAQRAGEFLEGAFYSGGVWTDVAPDVCHDAIRFGTGIAFAWIDDGELRFERVRPWELLVDEIDGADRKPRSVYRIRYVDRHVAAARWPDASAAILSAPQPSGEWATIDVGTRSDVIVVCEAYHLPTTRKGKDGLHVIAVEGAVIASEAWTHDRFPFAVQRYQRAPTGWYGRGVPDQIVGLQYDINATLLVIRDCHRFAGMQILVERGSKVVKSHLGNEVGAIVEYDGRPPTTWTPQTVNQEMYNWLQTQYQRCFERAGVSQLAAQAQLPAGLNGASGKALRAYVNESDSRFTAVLRDYEEFHVELARCAMLALEDEGDVSVIHRGKGRVSEISWREVRVGHPYTIQVLPASLLPQTVAGRLESVRDLINDGIADALGLDAQTIQRLLNWPDLEAEGLTSGRDAVDEVLQTMLDSGEIAVPDSTLSLDLCVSQGVRWYAQLRRDGEDIDSEKLAMLRTWIDSARELQQPPAPPPGEMPPPEMTPPPEGAPPPMPPEMMQ